MNTTKPGHEALAALVRAQGGLQTGPFGNELSKDDYTTEGIPVVMPRDLTEDGISLSNLARIPPAKADQLSRYRMQPGDVVLARRGKLGRCALISSGEAGWICGTGCFRVRLNSRRMDPSYLVQYLRWEETARWLAVHAVGQTMANLNTETLSQLPVWVPALDVQRRNARLLHNLERAIHLREKLWDLKSTFQRTLLRDALAEGMSGPHLPTGWRVRELGELCQLVNGNRFHRDDWSDQGVPIIRIKNLNGSQVFKYFAGYSKAAWRVEPGDLLLPWAGSAESVRPYLWEGPPAVLNQHIFRLTPRDGVLKRWLYEVLRVLAPQLQRLSQGFKKNMIHLHKEDVLRYPIAVPPLPQQMRIAHWSQQSQEVLQQRRAQVDLLEQLRRGLRNDLLSGREPLVRGNNSSVSSLELLLETTLSSPPFTE